MLRVADGVKQFFNVFGRRRINSTRALVTRVFVEIPQGVGVLHDY
jgi:hypothetical protein